MNGRAVCGVLENDRLCIVVISNIIFEPYLRGLLKEKFGEGIGVFTVPYEEYHMPEYQGVIQSAQLVIVWIDIGELCPDMWNAMPSDEGLLKECGRLYQRVSELSKAGILWFSFSDYDCPLAEVVGLRYAESGFVDRMNLRVLEMLGGGAAMIDLKRLTAKVGISDAFWPKGRYRWNAPYSREFLGEAADEIYRQYLILKGITKKCLVLDCDNVLWGGILSEDGRDNVKLGGGPGRCYQEFQRFVLSLYSHGVLLAVCSKNDYEDVIEIFRSHSGMILQEEHIVCFQVNWEPKAENIRRIAQTLNIGLDSIVFLDDSEEEIQSVRAALPEVTAIKYEKESVYGKLGCFHLSDSMDPDSVKKRHETYKTDAQRRQMWSQKGSTEEYWQALEVKVEIHEAMSVELIRIAELTQRTNKCTNGRRFMAAELRAALQEGRYRLYSVSVWDRFSDLGIVGAVGIEDGVLDLFSLSCRALGRNVENAMMDFIRGKEIHHIFFASTGKNEGMLEKLNGCIVSEGVDDR